MSSPDEHLEAMYEDANGGDVDTAVEWFEEDIDSNYWMEDLEEDE